jgi:two-component system, cell cycle sensor histidine kinase and response regulator CckA
MDQKLKLLVVEDSEDDCLLVVYALQNAGFICDHIRIHNAESFRRALDQQEWDVIISDYNLPDFSAPKALEILNEAKLDIPFIVISGTVGEETVVKLMKSGARDYVMKDHLARLPGAIERELKEAEARRQHRRVEEQFRQAQKMEAVGRLASGVAHDFNNLLTIITGFAQLALLEPNPAQGGLEQILRAADRAAGLTRQLLVFSRQQSLDVRVFNLNSLINDLEKMIRRVIGEDIEIRTVFHDQEANVKVDPHQIEQVILNLVVNSRDAMPQGGVLTIETQHYNLDIQAAGLFGCRPGEYFQLSVSDTGTGIDKATLGKIFEPFFTTKGVGRGTGLGLSTVYGIVSQSGGAIRAYSEPGVGTTMRVLVPAATEKATANPDATQNAAQRGWETVLLVEDDETVLALCATVLQNYGYTVLEADGVHSALEISRSYRKPIHLLVSDVVMPGANGPALAVEIREALPNIRTLFMSGYTEETMQQYGFSNENAGFIQKPFSASALAIKVRQVLDAGVTTAHSSV